MERVYGYDYFTIAYWDARPESPDELAARFLRYIDLLTAIDPLMALWISGAKGPRKLETIRDRFAKEVAAGVSKDDFGEATPDEGYWLGAYTRDHPDALSYAVRVHAGSHIPITKHQNDIEFSTFAGVVPDPRTITYRIFKAALLAAVEAWDPVDAISRPHRLLDMVERQAHFYECWMQYLSAPLAQLIAPPSTAIVERCSNGGILMSATDETFDVDNPTHLAVARDIAAAIAPLNELPYVRDPKLPSI